MRPTYQRHTKAYPHPANQPGHPCSRFCVSRSRGQALVLVALALPVLMLLVLAALELGERWMQTALVEDALQQATRSAVQTFQYAAFARGGQGTGTLRVVTPCAQVTVADAGCREVTGIAHQLFITNLRGVRGLLDDPQALADRVRWTVLPAGGTCSYTSTRVAPVTATSPLLCAEVRPSLRGLGLLGTSFAPPIVAAETLDPVTP